MNVSEPLRQETSSGKAAFMTQPCLSQPRPSGPRQRPRLCLSSPVPASATEGICGWETPSAPQAPIECRTAGPNTRPWGGGSRSSDHHPAICPQALEHTAPPASPQPPAGVSTRRSFFPLIHSPHTPGAPARDQPLLRALGIRQRARGIRYVPPRNLWSSKNTAQNK